jgi:hypothetical protein
VQLSQIIQMPFFSQHFLGLQKGAPLARSAILFWYKKQSPQYNPQYAIN